MDIPIDHPRYKSLVTRERLAYFASSDSSPGIVSLEGLTSHGRGEAFDYLMNEKSSASAIRAEKFSAFMLLSAKNPVLSINGNTAALAADEISKLQLISGAKVEVNLFHRSEERMRKVTEYLKEHGVDVLSGDVTRYLPLSHDRALALNEGIVTADLVFVPLEDGDRCEALIKKGKTVITIDLNPLTRSSRVATLPIIDELTRALPNITEECKYLKSLSEDEYNLYCRKNYYNQNHSENNNLDNISDKYDGKYFLNEAIMEIMEVLTRAMD